MTKAKNALEKEYSTVLRNFRLAGAFALLMIGVGSFFYHFVEKLNWLDAVYFCVVTLATVGYGDITPHTIILDKATLAVRDIVPGDDPSWFPDPALAHHALQTLGELAVRVEALLGAPVDLEAAYAFGQWHLLQARPITT